MFLTRSKSMGMLRSLHIEGLPPTMTAAELSQLMAPYGCVQYAEVSTQRDSIKPTLSQVCFRHA